MRLSMPGNRLLVCALASAALAAQGCACLCRGNAPKGVQDLVASIISEVGVSNEELDREQSFAAYRKLGGVAFRVDLICHSYRFTREDVLRILKWDVFCADNDEIMVCVGNQSESISGLRFEFDRWGCVNRVRTFSAVE